MVTGLPWPLDPDIYPSYLRLPKLKEWIDANDVGATMIPFSGAYEGKIADMDADARKAFCEENKATSAFEKIITQGYKVLQLMYFFTAGHDEVKAWSIQVRYITIGFQNCRCSLLVVVYVQKGTKAPQAAGRIHTDFEKGFIMAEVFKFNDLKEEGSEAAVKVSIFFLFISLFSHISLAFRNRQQGNTDSKANSTLSKTVISSCSSSMLELVLLLGKRSEPPIKAQILYSS